MKIPDNIFFVGLMGSGKTTTGRQLSDALDKPFFDCDREIENSTGASIPLIFDLEGESGFRKRESIMLEKLTRKQGIVLATGGGAVLSLYNRTRLASRGFVIYLHAPVRSLVRRTARDRNRPLLQTEDPTTRLNEIMVERDPLYRRVADMVMPTNKRSVHHVVKDILKKLGDI